MNTTWLNSRSVRAAITLAAVLAIGLCQPGQAEASFVMRLTNVETATVVTITDGGAGDLQPLIAGHILFSGAVGNFTLNVDTGLSKPLIGNSPTFAHMDLSSQNVTSLSGGTLIIELTDTSFPAFTEPSGVLYAAVGGTNGGTSAFDAWKSTTNQEFAANGLHIELPPVGTFGPGAFSDSDFLFHGPLPTFSMTLVATIVHSGPATSSFNFEVINATPDRIPGLPEPASMVIWSLGAGAIGLAGFWRRKRAAV